MGAGRFVGMLGAAVELANEEVRALENNDHSVHPAVNASGGGTRLASGASGAAVGTGPGGPVGGL